METREFAIRGSVELASRAAKKARNRGDEEEIDEEMALVQEVSQPRSWKDLLLGTGLWKKGSSTSNLHLDGDDDFDLLESNIVKATINGMSAIYFSNRINQCLVNGMAHTIIIKLLRRSIGYSALYNKVCAIWKPKQGFHLVDVENGYFLAKFQNKEDIERVLCDGPWIVYGQYLTVQPWTIDFDTRQPYPSLVMAWVKFPRLPRHMFRKKILWEIGGLLGRVAKLDPKYRE